MPSYILISVGTVQQAAPGSKRLHGLRCATVEDSIRTQLGRHYLAYALLFVSNRRSMDSRDFDTYFCGVGCGAQLGPGEIARPGRRRGRAESGGRNVWRQLGVVADEWLLRAGGAEVARRCQRASSGLRLACLDCGRIPSWFCLPRLSVCCRISSLSPAHRILWDSPSLSFLV